MSDDEPVYDLTTDEGVQARDLAQARNRIPPRFRDAEADHPDVIEWCELIAAPAGVSSARPSLLITGPTGTGKTWQAYGAVAYLAARGMTHWLAATGPDLHGTLRPREGTDSEAEFDRWAHAPLLFIDDFGTGKDSGWTEEVDYRIVNLRSAHMLPTIYTTNLPVKAPAGQPSLESVLSGRVFSRLAECTRVVLKGKDRRLAS